MAKVSAETSVLAPLSPISFPQPEPTNDETDRLLDRIAQWLADVAEDPDD